MGYGKDTESKPSTAMYDDRPTQAPNSTLESEAADALTALDITPGIGLEIITNSLDEEYEQVLQQRESSQRRYQIMATLNSDNEYVLTPLSVDERLHQTVGQPLASVIIAPAAATPGEVKEHSRSTKTGGSRNRHKMWKSSIHVHRLFVESLEEGV